MLRDAEPPCSVSSGDIEKKLWTKLKTICSTNVELFEDNLFMKLVATC